MSWSLIVVIIALAFLATAIMASAAPWLPAWQKDIGRIIAFSGIRPGQKFYDLGCGDGRVVCAAGSAGAQAIGIELSVIPFLLACARKIAGKNPAKILYKNLFRADLRDADIVYFFLTPPAMPKMKAKLEAELKKGSRVVSYAFHIPGWEPAAVSKEPGRQAIYLYRI
jgi:SAM-dependent methyltransferase